MRARNVKPGFFANEDLAECSPHARLLFIGLWQIADRDGRIEDRPRRLRGQIFPYESVDCDALLAELDSHGFIIRYASDGTQVLQITKFADHQRPHPNEPPSKLPPQPTRDISEHVTSRCEPLTTDSCNGATDSVVFPSSLNTESLNAESLNPGPVAHAPDEPELVRQAQAFEAFWDAYPRKEKREYAAREWRALMPCHELVTRILSGLAAHRSSPRWTEQGGKFIPHAANWLRDRRWEDELPKAAEHPPPTESPLAAAKRDRLARHAALHGGTT